MRPNPLADPEFAKKVAEGFADGLNRQEMCDLFGMKDRDTITRWRRDPRVKLHLSKLIEDRIHRITKKVDGVIEERLQNAQDLTTQELIMIRKEFLGGALRAETEKADESTVREAQELLEQPGMMEAVERMLRGEVPIPGTTASVEE